MTKKVITGNAKGKGSNSKRAVLPLPPRADVRWTSTTGTLLEDLRASARAAEQERAEVKTKARKVETVMATAPGPRRQFSTHRPGPDFKLYWAYGSNLDIGAMQHRCPRAVPFCAFPLADVALVFRFVADVVGRRGSVTPGGLWWVSPECERSLDRYEGVAWGRGAGLYEKRYVTLDLGDGRVEDVLFYKMLRAGISPPSEAYLATIERGYEDFGLDKAWLDRAVADSWSRKELTPYLRDRRARHEKQHGELVLGRAADDKKERAA